MDYSSIGKNIRKFRLERKLTQAALSEQSYITPNYLGLIERGEKVPSLGTLVHIINALDVSADVILCDVIQKGYVTKNCYLTDKLNDLSQHDKNTIYEVIDTLIKHARQ